MAKKIKKEIEKTEKIEKTEIEVVKSESLEVLQEKAKKEIEPILKEINRTSDDKIKEKLQQKIKEILISYSQNVYVDNSEILKVETQSIADQNIELQKNLTYVGFVYYFWSASTMNFKIIGLYNLHPIFELLNTKEMYYLDKPTMITNDFPIYWIQKGIPFTIETRIRTQLLELNEEIFKKGYNADLIRAMSKSSHFLNVYGKEKWTVRFISFILVIIMCCCLIEYIILQNYWSNG